MYAILNIICDRLLLRRRCSQLERFSALVSQDIFSRMFQPWRVLRILNERKHFTHSVATCLSSPSPEINVCLAFKGGGGRPDFVHSQFIALQMSAKIKLRSLLVRRLIAFSMGDQNNCRKSKWEPHGGRTLTTPSIAQSAQSRSELGILARWFTK